MDNSTEPAVNAQDKQPVRPHSDEFVLEQARRVAAVLRALGVERPAS